jgi:hypothetical protein
MSNDVDLTRRYLIGRVSFLFRGHGPSFPARVIVTRHTVSRKIPRNRRQAGPLVGSKITVAGESLAFFKGKV